MDSPLDYSSYGSTDCENKYENFISEPENNVDDSLKNADEENRLRVHVTLDNWIYEAYVEDVLPDGIEVIFEKNSERQLLPFDTIRFPMKSDSLSESFSFYDAVEFRSIQDEGAPLQWQRGVFKGSISGISDLNGESTIGRGSNDFIVPRRCFRKANTSPVFDGNTLTKFEINIPENLTIVASQPAVHEEFRSHISADVCRYIPGMNVLRIISRNGDATRKQISILQNIHLKHLEMLKSQKTELDSPKTKLSQCVEEFVVQKRYISFAVGENCQNLDAARKLEDITKILWSKNKNKFRVEGKTSEAVKAARNMLEYYHERVIIPVREAEFMVENDGKIIDDIIEESGVVRIEVGDDTVTNETPAIPFTFVGTRSTITDALAMFDFHLASLRRNKITNKSSIDCSVSDFGSSSKKSENNDSEFVEKFTVEDKFMGLAIGKKGCNLQATRRIKNVTKVELIPNTRDFVIRGKTKEAVKTARNMIQFSEKNIFMPEQEAEKILASGDEPITDIVEEYKLVRIELGETTKRNNRSVVPFTLVGTKSSIQKAEAKLISMRRDRLKNVSNARFGSDDCVTETFFVKKHLIGLAIGKGGANIRKAEKLPGIISIKAESESETFVIVGKNKQAVQKARHKLEYVEEVVNVPPNLAGKIIGLKAKNLRAIEGRYEDVRITLEKKDKNKWYSTEPVKFTITGPKHDVRLAIQNIQSRNEDKAHDII